MTGTEAAETVIIGCGGCGTELEITREDWDAGGVLPCLHCAAGADIDWHKGHFNFSEDES
jgi:hypothetical protein